MQAMSDAAFQNSMRLVQRPETMASDMLSTPAIHHAGGGGNGGVAGGGNGATLGAASSAAAVIAANNLTVEPIPMRSATYEPRPVKHEPLLKGTVTMQDMRDVEKAFASIDLCALTTESLLSLVYQQYAVAMQRARDVATGSASTTDTLFWSTSKAGGVDGSSNNTNKNAATHNTVNRGEPMEGSAMLPNPPHPCDFGPDSDGPLAEALQRHVVGTSMFFNANAIGKPDPSTVFAFLMGELVALVKKQRSTKQQQSGTDAAGAKATTMNASGAIGIQPTAATEISNPTAMTADATMFSPIVSGGGGGAQETSGNVGGMMLESSAASSIFPDCQFSFSQGMLGLEEQLILSMLLMSPPSSSSSASSASSASKDISAHQLRTAIRAMMGPMSNGGVATSTLFGGFDGAFHHRHHQSPWMMQLGSGPFGAANATDFPQPQSSVHDLRSLNFSQLNFIRHSSLTFSPVRYFNGGFVWQLLALIDRYTATARTFLTEWEARQKEFAANAEEDGKGNNGNDMRKNPPTPPANLIAFVIVTVLSRRNLPEVLALLQVLEGVHAVEGEMRRVMRRAATTRHRTSNRSRGGFRPLRFDSVVACAMSVFSIRPCLADRAAAAVTNTAIGGGGATATSTSTSGAVSLSSVAVDGSCHDAIALKVPLAEGTQMHAFCVSRDRRLIAMSTNEGIAIYDLQTQSYRHVGRRSGAAFAVSAVNPAVGAGSNSTMTGVVSAADGDLSSFRAHSDHPQQQQALANEPSVGTSAASAAAPDDNNNTEEASANSPSSNLLSGAVPPSAAAMATPAPLSSSTAATAVEPTHPPAWSLQFNPDGTELLLTSVGCKSHTRLSTATLEVINSYSVEDPCYALFIDDNQICHQSLAPPIFSSTMPDSAEISTTHVGRDHDSSSPAPVGRRGNQQGGSELAGTAAARQGSGNASGHPSALPDELADPTRHHDNNNNSVTPARVNTVGTAARPLAMMPNDTNHHHLHQRNGSTSLPQGDDNYTNLLANDEFLYRINTNMAESLMSNDNILTSPGGGRGAVREGDSFIRGHNGIDNSQQQQRGGAATRNKGRFAFFEAPLLPFGHLHEASCYCAVSDPTIVTQGTRANILSRPCVSLQTGVNRTPAIVNTDNLRIAAYVHEDFVGTIVNFEGEPSGNSNIAVFVLDNVVHCAQGTVSSVATLPKIPNCPWRFLCVSWEAGSFTVLVNGCVVPLLNSRPSANRTITSTAVHLLAGSGHIANLAVWTGPLRLSTLQSLARYKRFTMKGVWSTPDDFASPNGSPLGSGHYFSSPATEGELHAAGNVAIDSVDGGADGLGVGINRITPIAHLPLDEGSGYWLKELVSQTPHVMLATYGWDNNCTLPEVMDTGALPPSYAALKELLWPDRFPASPPALISDVPSSSRAESDDDKSSGENTDVANAVEGEDVAEFADNTAPWRQQHTSARRTSFHYRGGMLLGPQADSNANNNATGNTPASITTAGAGSVGVCPSFSMPHYVRLPTTILLGARLVHSKYQTLLIVPQARPGTDMILSITQRSNIIEHIAFSPHVADTSLFLDYNDAYCYTYQQRFLSFSSAKLRTVFRNADTLHRWLATARRLNCKTWDQNAVDEVLARGEGDDNDVERTAPSGHHKAPTPSATAPHRSAQRDPTAGADSQQQRPANMPNSRNASKPSRSTFISDDSDPQHAAEDPSDDFQSRGNSASPQQAAPLDLAGVIEGIYSILAIEAFEIERTPKHLTTVSARSLHAVSEGLRACDASTPFCKVLAYLRLAMVHFRITAATSEREATIFGKRISPSCKHLMNCFTSGPLFVAASSLFTQCVRVSQSAAQKADILCCATDGQNKMIVIGYLALASACEIVYAILPTNPAKALSMLDSLLKACCAESIGNNGGGEGGGGGGGSPAAANTPSLGDHNSGGAWSLSNPLGGGNKTEGSSSINCPASASSFEYSGAHENGAAATATAAGPAVTVGAWWDPLDSTTSFHHHSSQQHQQQGNTITQHMLWFTLAFVQCAQQCGNRAVIGQALSMIVNASRRIVEHSGWREGLQRSALQTVLMPFVYALSTSCPEVLCEDGRDTLLVELLREVDGVLRAARSITSGGSKTTAADGGVGGGAVVDSAAVAGGARSQATSNVAALNRYHLTTPLDSGTDDEADPPLRALRTNANSESAEPLAQEEEDEEEGADNKLPFGVNPSHYIPRSVVSEPTAVVFSCRQVVDVQPANAGGRWRIAIDARHSIGVTITCDGNGPLEVHCVKADGGTVSRPMPKEGSLRLNYGGTLFITAKGSVSLTIVKQFRFWCESSWLGTMRDALRSALLSAAHSVITADVAAEATIHPVCRGGLNEAALSRRNLILPSASASAATPPTTFAQDVFFGRGEGKAFGDEVLLSMRSSVTENMKPAFRGMLAVLVHCGLSQSAAEDEMRAVWLSGEWATQLQGEDNAQLLNSVVEFTGWIVSDVRPGPLPMSPSEEAPMGGNDNSLLKAHAYSSHSHAGSSVTRRHSSFAGASDSVSGRRVSELNRSIGDSGRRSSFGRRAHLRITPHNDVMVYVKALIAKGFTARAIEDMLVRRTQAAQQSSKALALLDKILSVSFEGDTVSSVLKCLLQVPLAPKQHYLDPYTGCGIALEYSLRSGFHAVLNKCLAAVKTTWEERIPDPLTMRVVAAVAPSSNMNFHPRQRLVGEAPDAQNVLSLLALTVQNWDATDFDIMCGWDVEAFVEKYHFRAGVLSSQQRTQPPAVASSSVTRTSPTKVVEGDGASSAAAITAAPSGDFFASKEDQSMGDSTNSNFATNFLKASSDVSSIAIVDFVTMLLSKIGASPSATDMQAVGNRAATDTAQHDLPMSVATHDMSVCGNTAAFHASTNNINSADNNTAVNPANANNEYFDFSNGINPIGQPQGISIRRNPVPATAIPTSPPPNMGVGMISSVSSSNWVSPPALPHVPSASRMFSAGNAAAAAAAAAAVAPFAASHLMPPGGSVATRHFGSTTSSNQPHNASSLLIKSAPPPPPPMSSTEHAHWVAAADVASMSRVIPNDFAILRETLKIVRTDVGIAVKHINFKRESNSEDVVVDLCPEDGWPLDPAMGVPRVCYFEVTPTNKVASFSIGLVGGFTDEQMPFVELSKYVFSSSFFNNANAIKGVRLCDPPIEIGDTVGCGFLPEARKVFYTLNGHFIGLFDLTIPDGAAAGTAASVIPPGASAAPLTPEVRMVYPSIQDFAVNGGGNNTGDLFVNFGASPFHFDFRKMHPILHPHICNTKMGVPTMMTTTSKPSLFMIGTVAASTLQYLTARCVELHELSCSRRGAHASQQPYALSPATVLRHIGRAANRQAVALSRDILRYRASALQQQRASDPAQFDALADASVSPSLAAARLSGETIDTMTQQHRAENNNGLPSHTAGGGGSASTNAVLLGRGIGSTPFAAHRAHLASPDLALPDYFGRPPTDNDITPIQRNMAGFTITPSLLPHHMPSTPALGVGLPTAIAGTTPAAMHYPFAVSPSTPFGENASPLTAPQSGEGGTPSPNSLVPSPNSSGDAYAMCIDVLLMQMVAVLRRGLSSPSSLIPPSHPSEQRQSSQTEGVSDQIPPSPSSQTALRDEFGCAIYTTLSHLLAVPIETARVAALRLLPCALPLLRNIPNPEAAEGLVAPVFDYAQRKDSLIERIKFSPKWVRFEEKNVEVLSTVKAKMLNGAQRSIVLGSVLPRYGTVSFSVRISRSVMTSGHSLKGGYFIGVAVSSLAPLSPTNNAQSWKLIKPPVVWALHDTSPQLTHAVNPTVKPNNFQRTFGSNDLITVVVNRDKGTVGFYRNSEFLKELYNDLPSDVDISPFVQMYNDDASTFIYSGQITPSATSVSVTSAVAVDALRAMLPLKSFAGPVSDRLVAEMNSEKLPSVTLSVFGSLPDSRLQVFQRGAREDARVSIQAIQDASRVQFSIGQQVYYENLQNMRVIPNPNIRGPAPISSDRHIDGIYRVVECLANSLNRIALPLVCEAAVASLEAKQRQRILQEENDTRLALHSEDRVRTFRELHKSLRLLGSNSYAPATAPPGYAFSAPLSHPGFVLPPSYCGRLATVPTGTPFPETPFIAIAEPAVPSTGKFSIRCQLVRGHHGQILGGGYYFGVCQQSLMRRKKELNANPPDVWALHDMNDQYWRLKHMMSDRRLPLAGDPHCLLVSGDTVRLEIDRDERTLTAYRQPANASNEISLGLIFDNLPKDTDLYPFVHLYNTDAVAILLPSSSRSTPIRNVFQQQRMAKALGETLRNCDGCISQHRETKLQKPFWYKCNECADFNLCPTCFTHSFMHTSNGHTFTQMADSKLLYSSSPPTTLTVGQKIVVSGAPVEFLSSVSCSVDSRKFNNFAVAKEDDAHALWGLGCATPTFAVTVEPNAKAEPFPFNRPVFVGIAPLEFAIKSTSEAIRNACLSSINGDSPDSATAPTADTSAAIAAANGNSVSVVSLCSDNRIQPKMDKVSQKPYGFRRGSFVSLVVDYAKGVITISRDWNVMGSVPIPAGFEEGTPLVGFVLFSSKGSTASVDIPLNVTSQATVTSVIGSHLAIVEQSVGDDAAPSAPQGASGSSSVVSRVVNIANCRALLKPLTLRYIFKLIRLKHDMRDASPAEEDEDDCTPATVLTITDCGMSPCTVTGPNDSDPTRTSVMVQIKGHLSKPKAVPITSLFACNVLVEPDALFIPSSETAGESSALSSAVSLSAEGSSRTSVGNASSSAAGQTQDASSPCEAVVSAACGTPIVVPTLGDGFVISRLILTLINLLDEDALFDEVSKHMGGLMKLVAQLASVPISNDTPFSYIADMRSAIASTARLSRTDMFERPLGPLIPDIHFDTERLFVAGENTLLAVVAGPMRGCVVRACKSILSPPSLALLGSPDRNRELPLTCQATIVYRPNDPFVESIADGENGDESAIVQNDEDKEVTVTFSDCIPCQQCGIYPWWHVPDGLAASYLEHAVRENLPDSQLAKAHKERVFLDGDWHGESLLETASNSQPSTILSLSLKYEGGAVVGTATLTSEDSAVTCTVSGTYSRYERRVVLNLQYSPPSAADEVGEKDGGQLDMMDDPVLPKPLPLASVVGGSGQSTVSNNGPSAASAAASTAANTPTSPAGGNAPFPKSDAYLWVLSGLMDAEGMKVQGTWVGRTSSHTSSDIRRGTFNITSLRGISIAKRQKRQLKTVPPLGDLEEPTPPVVVPLTVSGGLRRLAVLLSRHLLVMFVTKCPHNPYALQYKREVMRYHAHPYAERFIASQREYCANDFFTVLSATIGLIKAPSSMPWDLPTLAKIITKSIKLQPKVAREVPSVYWDAVHALVMAAHQCGSTYRCEIITPLIELVRLVPVSRTLIDVLGALFAWVDKHSLNPLAKVIPRDVSVGIELALALPVASCPTLSALPMTTFRAVVELARCVRFERPMPMAFDRIGVFDDKLPEVTVSCPFGNFNGKELKVGKIMSNTHVRVGNGGKYYYEIHLQAPRERQIATFAIGWGTPAHKGIPSQHVGSDVHSFAFCGSQQVLTKGTKEDYKLLPDGQTLSGARIGMLLDLDERRVAWSYDGNVGKMMPIPIKDVNDNTEFIAFASTGNWGDDGGMLVCTTANTFAYPPDGYVDLLGNWARVTVKSFDTEERSAVPPKNAAFYARVSKYMVAKAAASEAPAATSVPPSEFVDPLDVASAAPSSSAPSSGSAPMSSRKPTVTFQTPDPEQEALLDAHQLSKVPPADLKAYCSHVRVIESCLTTAHRYVDFESESSMCMLFAAFRTLRPIMSDFMRRRMVEVALLEKETSAQQVLTIRSMDATTTAAPRSIEQCLQMSVLGQLHKQMSIAYDPKVLEKTLNTTPMFRVTLFLSESNHFPQDMGGPYRQMWTQLTDEIMRHPSACYPHSPLHRNPLFRFIDNSKRVAIIPDSNRNSPYEHQLFHFFGQIMGHMVRAHTPLALDLSPFVWKYLAEEDLTIADFYEHVDSVAKQSIDDDEFFTMEIAHDVIPQFAETLAAIADGSISLSAFTGEGGPAGDGSPEDILADPKSPSSEKESRAKTPEPLEESGASATPDNDEEDTSLGGLISLREAAEASPSPSSKRALVGAKRPSSTGGSLVGSTLLGYKRGSTFGGSSSCISDMGEGSRAALDLPIPTLRRIAEHCLLHSMDSMLNSMQAGLWSVLSKRTARKMCWDDLEISVCGVPEPSVQRLKEEAFQIDLHPTRAEYFWRIVTEMTAEQRSALLCFASGQKRLPLVRRIRVGESAESLMHLPRAQSCSSLIMMPMYTSYEHMKQKLLTAVSHWREMEMA